MRIAVLADTHGRLPASAIPALREAEEIWHLGDFCDLQTLEAVRGIGPAVLAVRGNNDFDLDLPLSLTLERGGKSFSLIHIPPRWMPGKDFLLHGHTHIPRDEMVDGVRVLNPGSIGKADKGAPSSYAWLTLPDDGPVTWEVVRLAAG
ncbi:MAG: metallophosphoesterase family protein [Chthoniobacterales bacterium]|nr:metallophosphoesterase family protein [Chthoniobacterales bacterium]